MNIERETEESIISNIPCDISGSCGRHHRTAGAGSYSERQRPEAA